VSSKRPSDEISDIENFTAGLVTTPDDVQALARARVLSRSGFSLENVNLLEPPSWLRLAPRRRTFKDFEPFEL